VLVGQDRSYKTHSATSPVPVSVGRILIQKMAVRIIYRYDGKDCKGGGGDIYVCRANGFRQVSLSWELRVCLCAERTHTQVSHHPQTHAAFYHIPSEAFQLYLSPFAANSAASIHQTSQRANLNSRHYLSVRNFRDQRDPPKR